jgi:hypothetical protein
MAIKVRKRLVSGQKSLGYPQKQWNLPILESSGLKKHMNQRLYGSAGPNRLGDMIGSLNLEKVNQKNTWVKEFNCANSKATILIS